MSISTSTLRRAQRSFSRQLTKESTAPRFKTSVTEGVYQTPRFRPLDAQQDILPGVGGTIILVREDDAEEARRVIEEYRRAPTSVEDDETAEFNVNEDSPHEG